MKKGIRVAWVVMAVAALAPAGVRAQSEALDQGAFRVAGTASLSSRGGDDYSDRATTVEISPDVMYFVRSGVALGAAGRYVHSSHGGRSSSGWTIGPRVSFYANGSDASLHPYVTASVGLGGSSSEATVAGMTTTYKMDFTHFDGGVGLLALVTPSVGAHGQIFYSYDSYGGNSDGNSNEFGLSLGFDIFLGGR